MSIKVIIADDHSIVREGLRQLIELDDEIEVIDEAADGKQCLAILENVKPDVLLLDVNMPEMNGLEVLQALKNNHSETKVLILTIHNEVDYLIKAVDLGVNGYILKDSDFADLKTAIVEVYNGGNYFQPSLVPYLKNSLSYVHEDLDINLTGRELQVLKLLATGLYNKEIADTLFISEKTVKNHVSNIFKKINVSDRTQAAIYAIKNNIIEI